MSDLTVANTILEQMGGARRLQAMIGASAFLGGGNFVQFSFAGVRGTNKCIVTLDRGSDTYKMELWRVWKNGARVDLKSTSEGLYWDMLKPVFEEKTGLYLSL